MPEPVIVKHGVYSVDPMLYYVKVQCLSCLDGLLSANR